MKRMPFVFLSKDQRNYEKESKKEIRIGKKELYNNMYSHLHLL
jgi:hypothetical protein